MEVTMFGIDLAKEIFQVCACLENGKVVSNKRMNPHQTKLLLQNHKPSLIFMEACSASHFWARVFIGFGHTVKLIAPQFVKPFVKTNKSDAADAEAIVTAGLNANMRFVAIKSQDQLDLQMVHRVRSRLIRQRTALLNEARSILFEHGITFAKGKQSTQKYLHTVIFENEFQDKVSLFCRKLLTDLYEELKDINVRIDAQDERLEQASEINPDCKRIMKIPGVGVVTATAIIASVADPTVFKNGRQFSAWLGLVPRHTGSGGKLKLLGMSKRGDSYIRSLLIQGTQICLSRVKHADTNTLWARRLKERSCTAKAAVALANKNARIIWHLLTHKEESYKATSKAA